MLARVARSITARHRDVWCSGYGQAAHPAHRVFRVRGCGAQSEVWLCRGCLDQCSEEEARRSPKPVRILR